MNDSLSPDEGFLRRWARLKASPEVAPVAAPCPPPLRPAEAPESPAPTLEDVARLTLQSDYAAFLAKGVSPAVRRLALKKLFADPGFAVMDGLDIYIDDYTRASPLSDAMLAALEHAPGVLTQLLGESDEASQGAANDTSPCTSPAPSPQENP